VAVVSIEANALRVTFRGIHRFWTLRRQLTVPLAHIVDARRDPSLASASPGWRLLGAELPGVVEAGRFVKYGARAFWDVADPDKAVVIELREERYARLVLEVDEPDKTVATVRMALCERSEGREPPRRGSGCPLPTSTRLPVNGLGVGAARTGAPRTALLRSPPRAPPVWGNRGG
jgi:hypothetical protein